MAADIAVEPFQLLVSETEIGFAHRQQIGALIGIAVPAAESEIGIEGGAFAIPALRIHEHTVDQQRVALPFVPEACASSRYIRAVAALEHHRSEEHTSELQSIMRISYAVFFLQKKNR